MMMELQKPFPVGDIEWRVGATNKEKTKGIGLPYITNRAIQNRLDELFGPFGWKNEFKEWKNNSQLCGIAIKCGDEWITKWDGADDSDTEATKGGLSDAMKRAGYQWGIGRYLYEIDAIWQPIKPQGRSYVLDGKPQLPAWAMPEGTAPEKPQATPAANKPRPGAVATMEKLTKQQEKIKQEEADTILKIKAVYQELSPDGDLTGFEEFYQGQIKKGVKAKGILDWLTQKKDERERLAVTS